MSYGKFLYYSLLDVVENNPEKFFCNKIDYRCERLVMFDYSLVIPEDFSAKNALEARGSLFKVDENGDYLDLVCLPYEKFFNLHEFSYITSDKICSTFKERYGVIPHENIVSELIDEGHRPVFMDKRDGSIISFFDWNGELDAKSNSSLTSDYKFEALEIVKNDSVLLDKISTLCSYGFTVITEYTSKNPARQIVVPYSRDEIIVTGVRSHENGLYWSHQKIMEYFGSSYTVDTVPYVDACDYEQEGIEGYIVSFESLGLRFKLKTQWYLERHRVASLITPRMVWEYYITETIDDISGSVPEVQRGIFNHYIEVCDDIMKCLIDNAECFYEKNKEMSRKDYFVLLNTGQREQWKILAGMMYNQPYRDAIVRFKDKLLKTKTMSDLGIYLGSPLFETSGEKNESI